MALLYGYLIGDGCLSLENRILFSNIDDEILKDSRCKVLDQVSNGVCIRMAVLDKFANLK